MDELAQKNNDFLNIYTKSYRLAAAVFMISNMIDKGEELRTKIKCLSLSLVSMSVNLKDINLLDAKKLITDIEKNSLELMSMLDIACASDLISKMNSSILKEEFQSFVSELGRFTESFENSNSISVKGLFAGSPVLNIGDNLVNKNKKKNTATAKNENKNVNGYKRKDVRKTTILNFVKGHNDVSIKDIAVNITGCSEKTIQRELISLIGEGKIRKTGERRWSKYSVV